MCKRVLKVSHGDARAGIFRHIKNKHPFIYYKEKKQDLLVEDDSQFQTENTAGKIFLVNKVASEDDNIEFQEGESVESSVDSSTEWNPEEGEYEQAFTEELMTKSKDSSTVKKRKSAVLNFMSLLRLPSFAPSPEWISHLPILRDCRLFRILFLFVRYDKP